MKTISHKAKDQEAFSIAGHPHMFCLYEAREDDGTVDRWVQVMRARPEPHRHMYNSAGKLSPGSEVIIGDVTLRLEGFLSGGQAQVTFTAPDDVYIGFGRNRRRG